MSRLTIVMANLTVDGRLSAFSLNACVMLVNRSSRGAASVEGRSCSKTDRKLSARDQIFANQSRPMDLCRAGHTGGTISRGAIRLRVQVPLAHGSNQWNSSQQFAVHC